MKSLVILTFLLLLFCSFSCPAAFSEGVLIELGDTIDYKRDGDSVILPDFEISIKLSEVAENRIRNQKESIIVMAYYSGIPKNKNNKEYREEGNYTFQTHAIELINSRIARFKNVKVSKKTFATLANTDIDVLINVYSGRRTTRDNLLDVDILSEKIAKITGKNIILKGKLIGEK